MIGFFDSGLKIDFFLFIIKPNQAANVTPQFMEKSEPTPNKSNTTITSTVPSIDLQQPVKPKVSDMVKNYDSMTLLTIDNSNLKSKTSRLNASIVPNKNVISSVSDSKLQTVSDLMTNLNKFGLEVYKKLSNSIGIFRDYHLLIMTCSASHKVKSKS